MSAEVAATTPLISRDPEATAAIGAALGARLRVGDVLALDGPLGAGKTCLVRGMVVGFGGVGLEVRSPTFVLHQPHRTARASLHHVDLYRLGEDADIEFLDLDAMLEEGAVVIEWGSYADLARLTPSRIEISIDSDDRRLLRLGEGAPPHLVEAWSRLEALRR